MNDLDAILIAGPTAGGKSALALQLAQKHNGVVINTDSMQVYDTLQVLTARPSVDEMQGIEHLLYGHVPATVSYSTGQWLRDVQALLPRLKAEGRLPVFVGGTGLYFKALTGGLSSMPEVPAEIRDHYRAALSLMGPHELHAELTHKDPAMADRLAPGDGQRIVRALEILATTGRSMLDLTAEPGPQIIDPQRAIKIVVLPERSRLNDRINRRFQLMMQQGAIGEVQALLAQKPDPAVPAMKAIGVLAIAEMLNGHLSEKDAITLASTATRQYAKRQMTWFRNQMDESWKRLDPDQPVTSSF